MERGEKGESAPCHEGNPPLTRQKHWEDAVVRKTSCSEGGWGQADCHHAAFRLQSLPNLLQHPSHRCLLILHHGLVYYTRWNHLQLVINCHMPHCICTARRHLWNDIQYMLLYDEINFIHLDNDATLSCITEILIIYIRLSRQ